MCRDIFHLQLWPSLNLVQTRLAFNSLWPRDAIWPHGSELTLVQVTHWGRDKMDATLQATFFNAFSWVKIVKFRLQFHWSLSARVQLTIFQHWFRYLNQWWLVYRRIYTSLGLNCLLPENTKSLLEPSTIFDARHQWWEARVKMFECWKNIDNIKSM